MRLQAMVLISSRGSELSLKTEDTPGRPIDYWMLDRYGIHRSTAAAPEHWDVLMDYTQTLVPEFLVRVSTFR